MATWFVSRHPGAIAWAREEGLVVDHWCAHLEVCRVSPGDVVIGTLPVPLAAGVCERGAAYWHLALDLPAHLRGVELSAGQLRQLGVGLRRFVVRDDR